MVMSETPLGRVGPPVSAGSDVSDTRSPAGFYKLCKEPSRREVSPLTRLQASIRHPRPQIGNTPMRILAAATFALLLAACAQMGLARNDDAAPTRASTPVTTWIVGPTGHSIGQAHFTQTRTGVLIRLEFLQGALPPGWHAAHIHQIGDCSDFAAGFQAAGVHEGLIGAVRHGLLNDEGPDAGDLPNLFAPADNGAFGAEFFSHRLTLAATAARGRQPLQDENGAALIIHLNPDNHVSFPSGPRIACAALSPGR
jgi:superoxide dismutase, Cu-Zn family